MKQTIIFFTFIFVCILLGFHDLAAQPPGMPGAPDQAPIDGGLSLVAAAGAGYSWYKLKKNKK